MDFSEKVLLLPSITLFLFLSANVYGQFVLKQDSMGMPSREMEKTEYLFDGRMATLTHVYDEDGSMSGFHDNHRVFHYYPDGNLQYDEYYGVDNSSDAEWKLYARHEYAYDEAGNVTSREYRPWDENTMEWDAEPGFGTITTYNDQNQVLSEVYKEDVGDNGYQNISSITHTYNDDGRISEKLFTVYLSDSGGAIYEQTKDEYTWTSSNTALIERGLRYFGAGLYIPTTEISEVYDENNNVVEQVTSQIISGQPVLVERLTKYFSGLGFYGGFTRESYVNGEWQLLYDYVAAFDDFNNPISWIARDFNEETQMPEITSVSTTAYDLTSPMENIMAPWYRHLYHFPPMHKPLTSTFETHDNGEVSETRDFIYYYSDVVLSTAGGSSPAQVILFPNPSSGAVRFDAQSGSVPLSVHISSSDGRMVKSERVLSMEPLDISDLSPGMYICHIQVGKRFAVKTLVVR